MSEIVTQVDREAAAACVSQGISHPTTAEITSGQKDAWLLVQAFAAHRIAAEAAAIERAAQTFEDAITRGYASPDIGDECCHGIGPSRDCIACYDDELHSAIAAICARSPQ